MAQSLTAPDAAQTGPHVVASGEYHFKAAIDREVLPGKLTEIWAKVFYPKDINQLNDAPLIILLHGQHSICVGSQGENSDITPTGECKSGKPLLNHEGYNYLAENLASWGYFIVSVNTNLINAQPDYDDEYDWNNFAARGKMVLRHLSLLHQWATTGNAPVSIGLGKQGLMGKIDFSNVGLLGHSNGGVGVRAAYNFYQDSNSPWRQKIPGLSIKAIFEIAGADVPIVYGDVKTPRFLEAVNIPWAGLLPLCDGEIGGSSRWPFERMLLNRSEKNQVQKAVYQVWGANHDFFNTEWSNRSDGYIDYTCKKTTTIFDPREKVSPQQQKIAVASAAAFFRGHVGKEADPAFNCNFNPLYDLPKTVTDITQVDRDFTPSPAMNQTTVVEDFDKPTGTNSSGFPNLANQIAIEHRALDADDLTKQRIAAISWHDANQNTFFEAVIAGLAQGINIQNNATLDVRIGRADSELNALSTTDFSLALEDAAGNLSNEIPISRYALINGPTLYEHVGDTPEEAERGSYPVILKTVRIPVTAFSGIDLTSIHGVRFIFNKTKSGALYFSNIRLNRNSE